MYLYIVCRGDSLHVCAYYIDSMWPANSSIFYTPRHTRKSFLGPCDSCAWQAINLIIDKAKGRYFLYIKPAHTLAVR